MELKGGILIIGSLLWSDDNKRDIWRKTKLLVYKKIHVKVPIRYGKRSGASKNLTMVFSKDCQNITKLGTGYLIPFKNNVIKSFQGIENQARFLSHAEGSNDSKLKKGRTEWCTIGILFNPKIDNILKSKLVSKWKSLLIADGGLKDVTIYKDVLSNDGELNIKWLKAVNKNDQELVDQFDFILATCTVPTEVPSPSPEIIAKDIYTDNRKYFFNNIMNGISTFQDSKVLKINKFQ